MSLNVFFLFLIVSKLVKRLKGLIFEPKHLNHMPVVQGFKPRNLSLKFIKEVLLLLYQDRILAAFLPRRFKKGFWLFHCAKFAIGKVFDQENPKYEI
jgi:hypothetical protein